MLERSEVSVNQATEKDIPGIRNLWREYWQSVGLAPDFQSFAEEVRTLPGPYAPPGGRLLLARVGDLPAGTAALRSIGMHSCEAKRLYVRPQYRGRGLGRTILFELIKEARSAGYQEMYGDTLPSMTSALQMYRQIGFSEVGPYSSNPTPGGLYLRLRL
jgi:GNAT superfamily N-acetyltransferase